MVRSIRKVSRPLGEADQNLLSTPTLTSLARKSLHGVASTSENNAMGQARGGSMARSALRNRSVYGEGDEENWNREAEVVRNAGGDASSKTTSLVVADKAADISIGIQPPTSDPFDLSEEVSDRLGRKGKNVQRVFHDDDSEEYEEGGAVVQNPTPPRSQSPTIDMKKGKQRRRSSVKGPVSSQSQRPTRSASPAGSLRREPSLRRTPPVPTSAQSQFLHPTSQRTPVQKQPRSRSRSRSVSGQPPAASGDGSQAKSIRRSRSRSLIPIEAKPTVVLDEAPKGPSSPGDDPLLLEGLSFGEKSFRSRKSKRGSLRPSSSMTILDSPSKVTGSSGAREDVETKEIGIQVEGQIPGSGMERGPFMKGEHFEFDFLPTPGPSQEQVHGCEAPSRSSLGGGSGGMGVQTSFSHDAGRSNGFGAGHNGGPGEEDNFYDFDPYPGGDGDSDSGVGDVGDTAEDGGKGTEGQKGGMDEGSSLSSLPASEEGSARPSLNGNTRGSRGKSPEGDSDDEGEEKRRDGSAGVRIEEGGADGDGQDVDEEDDEDEVEGEDEEDGDQVDTVSTGSSPVQSSSSARSSAHSRSSQNVANSTPKRLPASSSMATKHAHFIPGEDGDGDSKMGSPSPFRRITRSHSRTNSIDQVATAVSPPPARQSAIPRSVSFSSRVQVADLSALEGSLGGDEDAVMGNTSPARYRVGDKERRPETSTPSRMLALQDSKGALGEDVAMASPSPKRPGSSNRRSTEGPMNTPSRLSKLRTEESEDVAMASPSGKGGPSDVGQSVSRGHTKQDSISSMVPKPSLLQFSSQRRTTSNATADAGSRTTNGSLLTPSVSQPRLPSSISANPPTSSSRRAVSTSTPHSVVSGRSSYGGSSRPESANGLPVVEITSTDPKAAARAAAILKVHHRYIQHGWRIEGIGEDGEDEEGGESFGANESSVGADDTFHNPRKTNAAQRRSSTFSNRSASATEPDELLREAEAELSMQVSSSRSRSESSRSQSPEAHRRSNPAVVSADPVIRSAKSSGETGTGTANRAFVASGPASERSTSISPSVDTTPSTLVKEVWTTDHWRSLERVYVTAKNWLVQERERMKNDRLELDPEDIVDAFYEELEICDAEKTGELAREKVLLRLVALRKGRRLSRAEQAKRASLVPSASQHSLRRSPTAQLIEDPLPRLLSERNLAQLGPDRNVKPLPSSRSLGSLLSRAFGPITSTPRIDPRARVRSATETEATFAVGTKAHGKSEARPENVPPTATDRIFSFIGSFVRPTPPASEVKDLAQADVPEMRQVGKGLQDGRFGPVLDKASTSGIHETRTTKSLQPLYPPLPPALPTSIAGRPSISATSRMVHRGDESVHSSRPSLDDFGEENGTSQTSRFSSGSFSNSLAGEKKKSTFYQIGDRSISSEDLSRAARRRSESGHGAVFSVVNRFETEEEKREKERERVRNLMIGGGEGSVAGIKRVNSVDDLRSRSIRYPQVEVREDRAGGKSGKVIQVGKGAKRRYSDEQD